MEWWLIIGVILVCITLFILKHTQVYIGYDPNINKAQWENIKLQLWFFILIILIGLFPIVNLILFIVFIFYYSMITDVGGDYRFKLKNFDNKIIRYLKKILTKEIF